MTQWLDPVIDWIGHVSPSPYLRALAAIVGYLLLAKLVDLLVTATLKRLLRHWAGSRREDAVRLAQQTVFRSVALAGLMIAAALVGLLPRIERITLSIIDSILILLWIVAAARGTALLLEALGQRPAPPTWARPTIAPLFNNMLRIVLALAGAYAILLAWKVNVTGLVASAGIVGLALSFAAQDTLGNLFAGLAILTDQPYRIGDYIVLDSGERGQVTHIGLRSTRILTRDDEEISIPNGIMGKAKIINESGGPHVKYRVRVAVGVAYESDVDQVIATLLNVASEHPSVCETPKARVRFRSFGDFKLNFELLVWISQPALRGLTLHELNCEIHRTFRREGIEIPFPQRDLHIQDWRPGAQES